MSLSIGEDNLLTTVWLLATLSGGEAARSRVQGKGYGGGPRSVKRKSVEKLDIVKTCSCIIDISNRVSLRRTSNLMFGTVLAYKGKCLQNWKDVNSCRLLIQRLNRVMGTGTGGQVVQEEESRGSRIQLLRDDPNFDISQGLVGDYEAGAARLAGNDWRDAYEVEEEAEEEMQVQVQEQEQAQEHAQEHAQEQEQEQVGTQTEKWEALEFGFDANGEVVNQFEPVEEVGEAEIQRSLMEGLEDGFGVLPELETVPEPETAVEVSVPTKRKARAPGGACKRLVIDAEVSLSVARIRTIRDGYVEAECRRRRDALCGIVRARRGEMVEGLTGVGLEFRAAFSLRGPAGGGPAAEIPVFDDVEIEFGRRRRSRSRSSSVSSVEEARRAERHSSSFHFDFDETAAAAAAAAAAGYDNDMDVAQLDISFTGAKAGSEAEEPCLASVEEFWDEVAAEGATGGAVVFRTLAPAQGCGRREACARFMYVLQLATWGRLDVSQRGARGDILLAVK